MNTLIETAQSEKPTQLVRKIAKQEKISINSLLELVAQGKIVIPKNCKHKLVSPCGIGKQLSVKVNANIGTSTDSSDVKKELEKLKIAIEFGADTVMDLSVGKDLQKTQKLILEHTTVPIGTVPIYQAAIKAKQKHGSFFKMSKDDLLDVLWEQAENGVDFFTVHCGVTKKTIECLKKSPRKLGIVSRGGAITAAWIKTNNQENPLFEYFDDVIKIAKKYDITLSLGDGLRPGSIFDATDNAQVSELKLLGKLAEKARSDGVQVMIEGPGHIPINQIRKNIELEKKYCNEAPFYVLGPLVTDIAVGYDHISAAIGSGLAAAYGADFICFVTPAEHLKLPDLEDIKLGVIASKIAAHSGDLSRGSARAWDKDKAMTVARRQRNWAEQIKMSIDPEKARKARKMSEPKHQDVCTMCGDFCSIKMMEKCFYTQ
ncbi:MAG: phosphomethylpyrimidine synthase [Candidatus Omnitrophota bacterium]|nr:MAG: phosphomethylpyrimidine synthase [Candidatus Omnitrophota bacterium]